MKKTLFFILMNLLAFQVDAVVPAPENRPTPEEVFYSGDQINHAAFGNEEARQEEQAPDEKLPYDELYPEEKSKEESEKKYLKKHD